jgi:hypothetical protein
MAPVLMKHKVRRIISSPAIRCVQTMQPLAAASCGARWAISPQLAMAAGRNAGAPVPSMTRVPALESGDVSPAPERGPVHQHVDVR